ncbi:ribosomal protein S18 acetylase RimI-like enzyme [Deinococcus sp. HSC-46F16]|uniref:GNAT family N-acetyltransferase n=1 Tax=Deinococcus sp. HSC-46F16 TaxID=2910968 RepID=UPI00209E23F5|nr:GNAT family N-acetyltransferase [Deinococcus sp. HSC-46F16]MCP2014753.1 ribosomal protein S18 acetylase RimI-like enzyme [Deinococcus sp. HSC-46F16]
MPASIRAATTTDAPALACVQVTSYRTAYAPHFPPGSWDGVTVEEQAADWQLWPQEHPDDVLLVAEAGGEVVGYVLARLCPFHGAEGEVLALHVLPRAQGQGHGAALLRAGVTALRGQGAGSVGLSTLEGNPIRAWYAALGGQEVTTLTQDVDGWEVRETVYVWPDAQALLNRLAPAP